MASLLTYWSQSSCTTLRQVCLKQTVTDDSVLIIIERTEGIATQQVGLFELVAALMYAVTCSELRGHIEALFTIQTPWM